MLEERLMKEFGRDPLRTSSFEGLRFPPREGEMEVLEVDVEGEGEGPDCLMLLAAFASSDDCIVGVVGAELILVSCRRFGVDWKA